MTRPLIPTLGTSLLSLCCAAALVAAPSAQAHDSDGKKPLRAGIEVRETGVLQEIGLPAYPGAVSRKDSKDEKSDVSLGLWGGPFGLKVQVVQMASQDSADKVAGFYRKALSQYGQVLDCSDGVPRVPRDTSRGKSDDRVLSCDEDAPSKGQKLFKVGSSSRNFRLVSVQPHKDRTHFEVVRIVIGRQD